MKIFERLLAVALAIAVGFSPLATAFAASAMAKHGSAGVASAGTAALHADHGKAGKVTSADGQFAAGCAQHDQCSGKCCAACAQCFTATFVLPASSVRSHAVQSPIVPRLHDRLVVAAHNRPPAA